MTSLNLPVCEESLISRQPIYDRRMKVYGYRVLPANPFFKDWGLLRSIAGTASIFLPASTGKIGDVPANVILDLPDVCDADWFDDALRLCREGKKLAVPRHLYEANLDAPRGVFRVLRFDTRQPYTQTLRELIKRARSNGVRILAEHIEDYDSFRVCQSFDCDYYHGRFYTRLAVSGRELPPSRVALLKLLTRLQDPRVSMEEIAGLVAEDAVLTQRLLNIVNSACEAIPEPVETPIATVMILGSNRVAALVSMLSLSGVEDKPSELISTAMVRARMCENLAVALKYGESESFFTTGLFSVLEALFDVPLAQVLVKLPVPAGVRSALTEPDIENPYSKVLATVLAYEAGNWQEVTDMCGPNVGVGRAYLEAIAWAQEAARAIKA